MIEYIDILDIFFGQNSPPWAAVYVRLGNYNVQSAMGRAEWRNVWIPGPSMSHAHRQTELSFQTR